MVGMRKRRRLRENDVGICASESERVYARQSFAICFREGLEFGRDPQFQFVEIDVRIRRSEMQASGNFTMLKNKHRFHESCDTGGRFQMSQISLHRTDR